MVNGFLFYYLFFVLDQPSVKTNLEPKRANQFHRNKYTALILGIVAFLMSVVVNKLDPNGAYAGTLGQRLIGAYTAIGMILFFGRLDSHYLKVPRVILAPLYLYGLIQLFWEHNISINNWGVERVALDQITIFSLALILKFVIFVTLSTWIRDGRFFQYIIEAEEGLRGQ
jgi:hypothetical protein